jgi:hypothetical protein
MIMDKEWLVNYAEKNMAHLMTLLKGEYEEVNPAKRDVATIIQLQDAINFYDTVLCITGVLHPDFDKHLSLIYNKAREEKEAEENGEEELQSDE